MEKIIITNEYVDFSQFKGITKNITIFLHNPDKLIIQLGHIDGVCAHKTILNEEYRIYNSDLMKILDDRGVKNNAEFIKLENTYYQL